MSIHTITQPKGGTGASTAAITLALLAGEAEPVILVDARRTGDLAAMLGIAQPPEGEDTYAGHGVTLSNAIPDHDGTTVIVDAGPEPSEDLLARSGRVTLVTDASYAALRRALRHHEAGARYSDIILLTNRGDALGARDVAEVIGAPVVAVIVRDAAVARSLDAGMFASRFPSALRRALGTAVSA